MKKIIVTGIQEASDSIGEWLEQAQLLVEGKSTHLVKKPAACEKCEFGLWLYSEEHSLKSFSWFKEIEELHQEFHDAYEVIYNGANEVHDAKSLAALKNNFDQLESQSDLLVTKLEEIKKSLENGEEYISEDNSDSTQEEVAEEVSSEDVTHETPAQEKQNYQMLSNDGEFSPVVMSAMPDLIDTKQLEMHRKLKELDLKQLEQEQKLTEQEVQQLEDRRELTYQSIDQIAQYKQLKEDEIAQELMEYQKLEDDNNKAKTLGQNELSRVRRDIFLKRDELEKLQLVDRKLESRKAEEQNKEQAILDSFERKQFADKQALIELEQQRKKWENEAVKLQQQLLLVEQDIEDLVSQQQEKQSKLDESNREKDLKLQELDEYLRQQEVLNGHKLKVKEAKQEELAELEQEKASFQQAVSRLEAAAVELKNQKQEMNKLHKRDLKQLDEQQRFKKMSMEKLDQDKKRKIQELEELVHQQAEIKKSLSEMEEQSGSDRALEKA